MPTKEEIARGAVKKNGKAPVQSALAGFGVPDRVGGLIGWDDCSPELIARLVIAFTRLTGAVQFGQSRDGGALQVALYLDNERKSVWIGAGEDVDAALWAIIERAEALA